jgi:hypothetical protein
VDLATRYDALNGDPAEGLAHIAAQRPAATLIWPVGRTAV